MFKGVKYKYKMYTKCLDTGNDPWCPTSITKFGNVNKWGYCLEPKRSNAVNGLIKLKNSKKKNISKKSKIDKREIIYKKYIKYWKNKIKKKTYN